MGTDTALADELRALALAYADGADRRDAAAFLTAFAPDAELEVHRVEESDRPGPPRVGHEALAAIPEALRRYSRTEHLIGEATYRLVGADEAEGEVACLAHHVRTTDAGIVVDKVMHIRYEDTYARAAEGWRIRTRRVVVERTEEVPVHG